MTKLPRPCLLCRATTQWDICPACGGPLVIQRKEDRIALGRLGEAFPDSRVILASYRPSKLGKAS